MTATATKKPAKKAPKKAKEKPQWSKEELQTYVDKIGSIEDEIRNQDHDIEETRQELKSLKERRAGNLSELRRLVWEKKHPEAHPLFNGKPSSNGNGKPHTPPMQEVKDDDSWKAVKLEEALQGLSPSILTKLHDANLHTMGELQAWTAADGGRHRISDIKGVGAAAAEKIEEASTAFWARRNKELAEKAKADSGAAATQPDAAAVQLSPEACKVEIESLTWGDLPNLEAWKGFTFAHKTVGDVFRFATKANQSMLDYLRSCGFTLVEADMVWDALKKAAKDAPAPLVAKRCTKCNTQHHQADNCPKCGCPEFALVDAPKEKSKGKKGGKK